MLSSNFLDDLSGKIILGVDEAGRGCWAGPLVVGAVILDSDIKGLRDSKKLTKKARNVVAAHIKSSATYCSTGWVWPDEIDTLGLTASTELAISRALKDAPDYNRLIIDGSYNFLSHNPKASVLIRADDLIPAVSAASILAKVERDEYMAEQTVVYPGYGFDLHVGYGTERHKKALIDLGVTKMHRLSYKSVQKILNGQL